MEAEDLQELPSSNNLKLRGINKAAFEDDQSSVLQISDPEPKSEDSVLKKSTLLYGLNDCPPWYTCAVLGFQHLMLMLESCVSIPYLLTPLMCMVQTDPARGHIASSIIFVSGLVTLLQTTFGIRLPIIQGGSHTFLAPVIAIISLTPCPTEQELDAMTPAEREEVWQVRMRGVQGAIAVAALLQIVIGGMGIVGLILKWISPLTVVPTVSLIGISLVKITALKAASNWWISSLTFILLMLFSQYLAKVHVPWLTFSKFKARKTKLHIFQMYPVLLTLIIAWFTCYMLTVFDVLEKGDHARTDLRLTMISEASWFKVPYPGQFGTPIITIAGVVSISAGIIASIIESVGDYYACARLAEAPTPPSHAMNRGIWMEGIGTVLAGIFGTGSGTTSYSQNVAAIGITKVGSRRVIQYAGGFLIIFGVIGKIGAIFINIPEPIIGGIFVVVFSMIVSIGLSSLQVVDLNSSRNLFILGSSLFVGLLIPEWINLPGNLELIQTSVPIIDEVLAVLLRVPMFLGGVIGFVLDNTIPGTLEERGIIAWQSQLLKKSESGSEVDKSYDLPIGMDCIRRWKWTRWIPVSPTFTGWTQLKRSNTVPIDEEIKEKF